jgi:hypothetical protein
LIVNSNTIQEIKVEDLRASKLLWWKTSQNSYWSVPKDEPVHF